MIDTVLTRFGLARMPFGRDLPPSRLHRHRDCGEAAALIAASPTRPSPWSRARSGPGRRS